MQLAQRLHEDMKAALKAGQKDRLQVIRMLLSDVKNLDLASTPTTAEQVVASYRKKLQKSVEEYEKIGHPEQAQKLKDEIVIVDEYLPKKASPEETEALVDAFLAQNAFTEKQVGQAMGAFMKQHGQDVEASTVNHLIRGKLAAK